MVANIRGGGEFGPTWHRRPPAPRLRRRGAVSDTPSTRRRIGESRFDAIDAAPYRPFRRRHQAAKKEKRHVCVEDLAAVAEDLVKTGVAQHESLGIRGGSNGGLLVGNFFVQRPELVGAVVCAVPLLDMKRYSHLLAGASWRAEYGDPDIPEEWSYLKHNSAYHNIDATKAPFPKLLMTTSTKDDRVHPYHARSFVKRAPGAGRAGRVLLREHRGRPRRRGRRETERLCGCALPGLLILRARRETRRLRRCRWFMHDSPF